MIVNLLKTVPWKESIHSNYQFALTLDKKYSKLNGMTRRSATYRYCSELSPVNALLAMVAILL